MKPMIEELIQYKEWHVATQRQLKKRYDQIHTLTVLNKDLENSEKRAYAALKAKTEDYDKLLCKYYDVKNLQEVPTPKAISGPLTEVNCNCAEEKEKPFKALVTVSNGNTPVSRKTEFMLQYLANELERRGGEVHIEIKQHD